MKTKQKNFIIEIGAHCTFLGFLGILSLIFTGIICFLLGFSNTVFYSLLGVLFVVAVAASAYCITYKSHTFKDMIK